MKSRMDKDYKRRFGIAIKSINSAIEFFKEYGVKIRDIEEMDWALDFVMYDAEIDEVVFFCEEDKWKKE